MQSWRNRTAQTSANLWPLEFWSGTLYFPIFDLFIYLFAQVRGRASSVGIQKGYELYCLGLFRGWGIESSPALGPYQSSGIGGYFSRCEAAGHGVDNSPPTNVEVNNGGAIPPFSHKSSWRGA
jgi:hypothetical protein